jgi:hypothetical protein
LLMSKSQHTSLQRVAFFSAIDRHTPPHAHGR